MMESPDTASLLNDLEDSVADAKLAIRLASAAPLQQAAILSEVLSHNGKPHSRFLAELAAAILHAAREGEAVALVRALEAAPEEEFSENARESLLNYLWMDARRGASDDEIRVFGLLTARYFLLGPATPQRGKQPLMPYSPAQLAILAEYTPWILNSERGLALFRTEVPQAVRQEVEKRILALARDSRSTAPRQADLDRMLRLVRAEGGQ